MSKHIKKPGAERKSLSLSTRTAVLIEAGYRCAVPTCRGILALDLHHIWKVNEGGGDNVSNLIALCPTDHALYHRGTISVDAIYSYKAMLTALNGAFDNQTIDLLLFISTINKGQLIISGDGLLKFARVLSAGLAQAEMLANNNNVIVTYTVWISEKGRRLIDAWKSGDRIALKTALGAMPSGDGVSEYYSLRGTIL
jgi:hypothetical protein